MKKGTAIVNVVNSRIQVTRLLCYVTKLLVPPGITALQYITFFIIKARQLLSLKPRRFGFSFIKKIYIYWILFFFLFWAEPVFIFLL